MLTPELGKDAVNTIKSVLLNIVQKPCDAIAAPRISVMRKAMTVRAAMLSVSEVVASSECVGRVLAAPSVSCPPAVPIAAPGEELSENAVDAFVYYGINEVTVVK